ncbi:MAG: GxxExxY protein [Candidatus Omnitrophica bacterium]|nr:GxxExxY protein [Candidatus Omnitrophota bacterium]
MRLELKELTGKIIEGAIKVHKELGPGFLESIYQTALPIELLKQGLEIETQKEIKIYYDGKEIGIHRLDIVVNKQVIVELKAVKEFDESHLAQVLSYLKATDLMVGLLLNFAKGVLKIKRVVN